MLTDVSKNFYRQNFTIDSSPYISEAFIGVAVHQPEKLVRLMKNDDMSIGLIAGINNNKLLAPFSAPFGGFHYTHEHLSYQVVIDFIKDLKEYIISEGLKGFLVTLPPNIYQKNMNAKFINAFIREGFTMMTPDILNWIDLTDFDGTWVKNSCAQNYRKALKYGLSFNVVTDKKSIESAYDVIYRNRIDLGREIYMSLDDLLKVNEVIPVDFFLITDEEGESAGAGIFYRGHEKIVQGVFLGDTMERRNLGVMDLMFAKIFEFYKQKNFGCIDLGISSLHGEPNVGLIRFKEIHNCTSSLRYTFSWSPE